MRGIPPIDRHTLSEFCTRWKVVEFALFGSVLRDDFSPDSDVDVLVTFDNQAKWTLFDLAKMQDDLSELFGRHVDVVTRRGVEHSRNAIRRNAILSTAQVVHAS